MVVTLDEVHLAARRELAALAALLQEGTGERWPLVVVLAGLPLMRAPEHSVTYLERGAWHELGMLSRADAVRALRLPAQAAARPMDGDAALILAEASGGYPFAVQLYGHYAWRAPTTARALADELGRTPKQLSSVRDELIKQGTLTVEGDELRFTIPGMSAFVLKR